MSINLHKIFTSNGSSASGTASFLPLNIAVEPLPYLRFRESAGGAHGSPATKRERSFLCIYLNMYPNAAATCHQTQILFCVIKSTLSAGVSLYAHSSRIEKFSE